MYRELSKEELLEKFDEYITSEDIKKRAESTKILGYLGINDIKSRMDNILSLTFENDISIRLNLITAFSNILNKFPEVFSELIGCIYYNTEFSNNILSEHAKNEIKALGPEVIERHVEHFRNGIYSKNTEERLKSVILLSLISRFSPEYLDKALSEIVMASTYDSSALIQLLALGTLDDFSEINRNFLRYSYLVFNKKMDITPLNKSKTGAEITKSLIRLTVSDEIDENTINELLNYLSIENDFCTLLAAISLQNNILKVEKNFEDYPLIFQDQLSKFYKKHPNNVQQLISYSLILDITHSLNLEIKNVDFEKIFYYLKKNISGKDHISKAFSLIILYLLHKMEKLNLDEEIDEIFDNYPFENILKEHPLCYYFGMPLLAEKYNTLPEVDKSPYLIQSLKLKMQYMAPTERHQYIKSAEKNIKSDYLEKRPELLTEFNTASKIKSVLGSHYVNENYPPFKIAIKSILDKILKNLENTPKKFQDELSGELYSEQLFENPVTSAAFLEKLKINLDSYILKNDEKNILKVLTFLKTHESKVDCSYLLEELVKLKDNYPDANYFLNNIKNRYKLIPKPLEIRILNSLNNPIPEYKKDGLEEIITYLNEGFKINNGIGLKIKEILVMYRDEKLTDLCINILNLQNDIESKRLIFEKREFDTHLNDLKEIKEKSDENIKQMSTEELYVKLSSQLHKTSEYDYQSINFNDILYFLSDYSKRPSVILTTMILKILKNVITDPNSNILNSPDIDNPKVLENLYYLIYSTDYEILSKNAIILTVEIVKNKPEWLLRNITNVSENKSKNWPLFLNSLLDYPDDKVLGETINAFNYYAKNSNSFDLSAEFLEKLVNRLDTSNWENFKKIVKVLGNYEMDEKMLNRFSKLLLEKIENSNDDSKLILLRFFKIQDISRLNSNLVAQLLNLKNSKNYDIKRDIEEIESMKIKLRG
ncbi:hypothetical protein MMKA1_18860 [Methanococcus maripaludis KA1]|uniref:Uncharacterized protein n=1 Tax=Methanococcus maripaludis KA1 TaxID=637914 RepID=A0A2Z5PHC6_METMI|nr:hypothetical protein [Methanococcus maripaludis]BAP62003.1 hypothetical protein MMKA1_18860 [Methanococcus maripaludis KA1]